MDSRTFWTRVPRAQLLACIVSALVIGFALNRMTETSDAAAPTTLDDLVLVFYLGLSLSCYIGALWLASRYTNLKSTEAIPGLLFVSIVGTSLPFLVNSVHIWFANQLELAWFVSHSRDALVLLNVIMIFVLFGIVGLGLIVSKLVQAIAKTWSRADTPGI